MATVKLIFNKKKISKEGFVPFYFRIIKDRKAHEVSTGVVVHIKDWDPVKKCIRRSDKAYQEKTNHLIAKLHEAQVLAMNMETENKYVSSPKIRKEIMGYSKDSFINYAEYNVEKLEKQGKIGTWTKEKGILSKLKAYVNNKNLSFFDIDIYFLTRYEDYLRDDKGNGVNTIHTNLKFIRKLFNQAVREDIIKIDKNPFIHFQIKREQTQRNFLTEDEIKLIEDLDIKPELKLNHHRNLYIFAIYAAGIRISDLLQLKWINFDGVMLNLKVQKTNDQLSIKLPHKALVILDFYKKRDSQSTDFIFPFLKNDIDYSKEPKILYKAISSATAYANKDLGKIATKVKIKKKIHFHTSRHTFATRALNMGMRIEYVSKLMAHSSIRTTQVYAKIVNKDLEKAMDIFDKKPVVPNKNKMVKAQRIAKHQYN